MIKLLGLFFIFVKDKSLISYDRQLDLMGNSDIIWVTKLNPGLWMIDDSSLNYIW
jgi:hypothetical protein